MKASKWKLSVLGTVIFFSMLMSGLAGIGIGLLSKNESAFMNQTAAAEDYVMNDLCEVILTASTLDASDAFDVIVSAVFTGPGGQKYEIPGKYKSDNQWIIRFQAPVIGQWSYVTSCMSHPSDTGLHNITGTVTKYAETEQPKVFLATDYVDKNAADATSDMRRLFREASTYTRNTGLPVEVRLEAGANYQLDSMGSDSQNVIVVSGVKNMLINGQGATLTGLNIQSGIIQINGCENIIMKDLNIDYDPLPYSYGTVTYISGTIFRFKIDEGFIEFDYPAYELAVTRGGPWGIKLSYENGVKIYGQPVAGSSTFKSLGNREWELDTSTRRFGPISNLGVKVNDKFVLLCRNYAQAVGVISTKNAVLQGINVYASPGLAYYPSRVEDFVMRDCHVKVKDDRPISTDADGIHMRGARGNVLIENCSFEGMLDDAINMHSSALSARKKLADNKYELSKGANTIRVGDHLQVVEQGTSRIKETLIVTEVVTTSIYTVTFDQNVELKVGTGFTNSDNLYNLDECTSAFVIKDCTFNSYRGRGILPSCQNGLIYNNTFNIQGNPCIHFTYETVYWGEGPMGRNIIIKNNTFNRTRSGTAPIVSNAQIAAGASAPSLYENIYILNNSFVGFGISASGVISMSNTVPGTPVLEGNTFTMLNILTNAPTPTSPAPTSTPSPVSSSPVASSSAQPTSTPEATQASDISYASEQQSEESQDSSQINSEDEISSEVDSDDSVVSEASESSGDKENSSSGVLLVIEIIVIIGLLAGGAFYFIKTKKH